jgi:hypothetical protein
LGVSRGEYFIISILLVNSWVRGLEERGLSVEVIELESNTRIKPI